MERNLFGKLEGWKNKKKRKPLIIQGARQVGKTWIMKEFGKRLSLIHISDPTRRVVI